MYLVQTIEGTDEVVTTADEVKKFGKNEVKRIYALSEVDYDDLVSTADIRDCICSYIIKERGASKDDVLNTVANILNVKKSEVSKVITMLKKEKILYVERDYGWLGIIETGRR